VACEGVELVAQGVDCGVEVGVGHGWPFCPLPWAMGRF
jgi:hypothetical protein